MQNLLRRLPLIATVISAGLEGLVSKHRDRPYRGGASKHWIKVKNPAHPAYLGFAQGSGSSHCTGQGNPSGRMDRALCVS